VEAIPRIEQREQRAGVCQQLHGRPPWASRRDSDRGSAPRPGGRKARSR
jgi:hypothetical protein